MNTAMRLLSRLGGLREEEPSPEKAGGGGGSDSNDNNNNPAPELDYDKLAAAIVKQQQANTGGEKDEGDIYSKTKQRQEEQAKQREQVDKIRAIVEFDKSFDGVLTDNKTLFSMTPKEIREGAKNLQDEELVEALKRTAAKDFFSKEENLKNLDDAEQRYAKEEIVRVTEKYIDADKAWSLVEKSLLINKRIQQHAGFKQAGSGASTETPNIDAYIKKCQDRGAGITDKQTA